VREQGKRFESLSTKRNGLLKRLASLGITIFLKRVKGKSTEKQKRPANRESLVFFEVLQ